MKRTVSTVGEQIRCLRMESGCTLNQVSVIVGMDLSLLGKIERGERLPTKQQVRKLASYYKVDSELLIFELLSDQLAYKILEEGADTSTFKLAEQKVEYIKHHGKQAKKHQ